MKHAWILVAALAACGGSKSDSKGDTVENIQGTATVGGKPAKITSCKAVKHQDGEVTYTVIELGLDNGMIVAADSYLGSTIRKGDQTEKLSDCTRNALSGSDGGQADKPWSKGTLGLTCKTADGDLVIDATYDCGAKDRPSNMVR